VPPAYPTRVRMTPSMIPNRDSMPQNQPKPKLAVSTCAGAAASMGGMADWAGFDGWAYFMEDSLDSDSAADAPP
jgi:hypothetical protein